MKKFALALLALATALAITPAAMATTFDFSYTSNDTTTAAFVINASASPLGGGEWVATSGSGMFFGLGVPAAGITLVTNPSAPAIMLSPDGAFNFDDVLLPGQDPVITYSGLLFDVSGGSLELNIFSNGPGPGTYQAYLSNGNNDYGNVALTGVFPTATPEPSSLLLLGTGLLGLAIVLFRKARPSGLVLHT